MEVKPGSTWMHYSGNRYTVICVANEESEYPEKYPVTVVYRSEFNRIWSRPLAGFLDNFIEVNAKEPE